MAVEATPDLGKRASIFAALGDPGRLSLVEYLRVGDASPSELQHLLSMPSNLIAHHVNVLVRADIVRRIRSEGDRRRSYLSLNAEALESVLPSPVRRARRVVFVCTRNSDRSQLAAAIWNSRASIRAASAGTHPVPGMDPDARAAARRHGLPIPQRIPAHLDDVLAPRDLIVVVCDAAHEELPGDLPRIHWAVPDPRRISTPDTFDRTIDILTRRIDRLVPTVRVD
jgi:protein-tyrosine-phosphatase